jgi:hypothetical protein
VEERRIVRSTSHLLVGSGVLLAGSGSSSPDALVVLRLCLPVLPAASDLPPRAVLEVLRLSTLLVLAAGRPRAPPRGTPPPAQGTTARPGSAARREEKEREREARGGEGEGRRALLVTEGERGEVSE